MCFLKDLRHKRMEVTIELRKTLRDQQILKHRNIVIGDNDEELEINYIINEMTLEDIKGGTIVFLI